MAAYAALASLMNTIDDIINHPTLSTSLHNINQIQLVMEKARLLLDFMEGYNYGVLLSKEVEDLERRITSAAYAAEDVIESQIVHHIPAAAPADVIESLTVDRNLHPSADDGKTSHRFLLKVRNKIRDMTRRMATCMAHALEDVIGCRTVDLLQITEGMDAILKKANDLKDKEGLRLGEEEQPTSTHSTTLMEIEGSAMVGFEEESIQLMDELTSQRTGRHVISIVGMGGTGKSTLAHNLYHNSDIKQHFDFRAWATVSQQYNAKEILTQFLFGKGNSSHGSTVGELGVQLHKTLYARRYLIVLDDLWSVEAWDEVSQYFPNDGNGSRVFLTTRLSNVASVCGISCFPMKPPDDDANWKLFCKKAFEQDSCPYPELEKVGKKIARLCKGLPLSTVVIGGLLLKSPRSLRLWKKVAFNIKSSPHSKEKEDSLDILSLSYNHLPPHLKPCFLYMGVFKEDSRIRVSKLIKLWIAEGFIRPNNTQILEELAEGYLKDLIDRNLIVISTCHKNGKMSYCGIHDLLRDLCLKLGDKQDLFHVNKGNMQGTNRRLVCRDRFGIKYTGTSLTRTILAFDSSQLIANHKLLRVCGVEHIWQAGEFYGNVNLRYLNYQLWGIFSTRLKLSSSISLLWNLQTLIIRRYIDSNEVVAPSEIWEMRQLRHVKCPNLYLPDPPPRRADGLRMMENLQTLTTVVNFRLCDQVCELIPNIKKLSIALVGRVSSIEYMYNLECFNKLETLKLNLYQTSNVYSNERVKFPISLKKLFLIGCVLVGKHMSMIGSLPNLEVLHLRTISVDITAPWRPNEGQFMRLKHLEIDLSNLIYWEAEDSHFPVLEKLVLSRLTRLKEIPLGIGDIPTLGHIVVRRCSISAAVSAVRIKEDQRYNQGNDDLQLEVMIEELEVKSFMEKVTTEGIVMDGIELEIIPYSDRIEEVYG